MGRRRKFEEPGCVVCGYVPYSLARALEEVARRRGVTISDLVLEALRRYLEDLKIEMGLQLVFEGTTDGQVEMDKVDLIDAEEFERSLERLEEYVERLGREAEELEGLLDNPRLLSWPKNEAFLRSWLRRLENAEDWFNRLRRWYRAMRSRGVVRKKWDTRLYDVWSRLLELRDLRAYARRRLR